MSCLEACCLCGGKMPATAFDPIIKVNLMPFDIYTFDLREVMVQTGVKITEGLCVGILAWRADRSSCAWPQSDKTSWPQRLAARP